MEAESLPQYRALLSQALSERQARNQGFSLRAFARQLRLQPGHLSRILSGHCELSRSRARSVALRAFSSVYRQDLFLSLVELSQASNQNGNIEDAKLKRIRCLEALSNEKVFDPAHEHPFSSWLSFAVAELTEHRDFDSTPEWLSKTLGVARSTVIGIIETLESAGVLIRDPQSGRLKKSNVRIETKTGVPNQDLRRIHGEFLDMAKAALIRQEPARRKVLARTVCIREQDWEALRSAADAFFSRVAQITYYDDSPSHPHGQGERLIQIQLQMFGLEASEQGGKPK